ncbi:MAG: transcription termination/antitermination factor NusG [Ruminococcaceae bacterium]|nr:transcription termination/antitermination factor NusG [Oscillospiraceae bacterium]
MADNAKWYVVHTYSAYENTVKATLEKIVENRKLHDYILNVSIPMETVTEVTDEGTKTVERKVFPGYVLVKMILTDETWYIVKNVRGVTGFVGSGDKPTPLTDEEVAQLGVEKIEIVVGYDVGDNVRVIDGPLTSFSGIVEELSVEKNKVRVVVSMFGRETPVELELDQVEPITVSE